VSRSGTACGRARRLLWPDGGPRSASPEVVDAQEHVAGCAACRGFMREMRAVGEAVRESAPREQAPSEVRERLFAALAHARAGTEPGRGRYARNWMLLAAAVLFVTVGAPRLFDHLTGEPQSDGFTALAEDHARAVGEVHIASTDPAEVATWVGGQVHFAVQVPGLPGASLRGARMSVFDGRRSAVLEYDVNGIAMSYFVIPNDDAPDPRGPMRFDRTARAGYQVVSWTEPGLLHAMVGNLSSSQLLTLAKACVEQAGRSAA
jgi:anti-sigma factor RsiW